MQGSISWSLANGCSQLTTGPRFGFFMGSSCNYAISVQLQLIQWIPIIFRHSYMYEMTLIISYTYPQSTNSLYCLRLQSIISCRPILSITNWFCKTYYLLDNITGMQNRKENTNTVNFLGWLTNILESSRFLCDGTVVGELRHIVKSMSSVLRDNYLLLWLDVAHQLFSGMTSL